MSEFGENESRHLSNFLQTHIFWNFDHISRICNQINYRNIWFPKVIMILYMTEQVLFFQCFFQKRPVRFYFPMESAFNRNIEFILPSRIPISACCQFIECLCRVISVKDTRVCADENMSRGWSPKVGHKFSPHFCM